MLKVDELHAFYGKSHVLHGVSFEVGPGQIVALLGRNGCGRSTTARALMGLVRCEGRIVWRDRNILGKKTYEIAQQGIGYVPEGREVFPGLTVHQNLELGRKGGGQSGRWTLQDMYALFPALRARQHTEAAVLSGGEQQMLALCRTLMGDPALIVIDEPTEGLAPKLVAQVGEFLQALKSHGVSVLLIEQKLTMALAIADRALVMGHGRIVFDDTPQALRANPALWQEWLAV